jgi:predicted AAA+ superfamily ATPase
MPSMWIKRDISNVLAQNTNFVEILIGPRQCGKSSLFYNLSDQFIEISLDDYSIRENISQDPMTFLEQFEGKKLLIDEAQLAPELFSAIKRKIDLLKRKSTKRETIYRLTGSNQILLDKNVKESLAGRASYFELNTLSVAEILNEVELPISEILFKGGWPEIYANQTISSKKYLDDYIRAYVEKDIILSAGIQKQNEFIRFAKLLAGRTAQLLNNSEIAKEVGVNTETIRDWISVLERMKIITLVQPFNSNYSNRLVKSPKVFFLDTGIACRLQGHSELTPLLTSPQLGPLFETLVNAELYKTMKNFSRDWQIYHWRSRDGEEIDFFIQLENNKCLFLECKVSRQSINRIDQYPQVKKVFKENTPPYYLCHMQGDKIIGNSIPISQLRDFLLSF